MAKIFGDNSGRKWTVEINVGAIKRVRTLCGVDLLEMVSGGDLAQKMSTDPVLLCDVLFALVKTAADAAAVTDEDFGRAMAGDAIADATQAFLDELVDFFPRSRRGLLRKAIDGMRDVEEKGLVLADKKLDLLLAQASADLLAKSGAPSTNSPAPSA
jgi:hypothetical protein